MDRKLGQISGKHFSPAFRCMQENHPYRRSTNGGLLPEEEPGSTWIRDDELLRCGNDNTMREPPRHTKSDRGSCYIPQHKYWLSQGMSQAHSESLGTNMPQMRDEEMKPLPQAHTKASGTRIAQMRSEACGPILPRTHIDTPGTTLSQAHSESSGTVLPQMRDEENEAHCLKRTLRHREHAWLNCNWPCPCTGIRSYRAPYIPRGE